jgi:DNA-binding response OmpR family regulator
MDAVYVVLSSGLWSTNIISLLDIGIVLSTSLMCFGLVKTKLRADRKPNDSSVVKTYVKRKESIAHEQQLRRVSHQIARVINDLINRQYVLADRKEYASILQTPLRDNLKQLRSLVTELNANNYKPKPLPRHPLGVAYANVKVNSAFIVADILPALKNFAQQQNVRFHVQELAHAQLNTPHGMVDKMLRELLLNAIIHNPSGTDLRLSCTVNAHNMIFEIVDNGLGIRADALPSIALSETSLPARRYRRLSDAETHLNIRSIACLAHHYDGELAISSALGMGTHVRLILPCSPIIAMPKMFNAQNPSTHFDNTSRKRVMLIGNHSLAISMLASHLDTRYSTLSYKSFDVALRALLHNKPDIVIADFSWQDALGIQLCRFLRASKETAHIPVIMVTAAVDQSTRVNAYASGVSAILQKPLDADELCVIIENLLTSHYALPSSVSQNNQQSNTMAETRQHYQATTSDHHARRCDEFGQQIRQLVIEHYQDEAFTVKKAAELMNMSEKTFQRRVKVSLECQFKPYLRRFRLERAKEAMIEGRTITQVAFDNGFNSTSYFGQSFKQEYGYPPSELIKSNT